MVELEDLDPNGFSLWLDGNMPSSSGTLPYVTSRRYLLNSGFSASVLHKYNLYRSAWKARAPKDELFQAAFCALVENTCKSQDKNHMPDIDAYILNPPRQHEAGDKILLLGPTPTVRTRRSMYRQIVLAGSPGAADKIRQTSQRLQDVIDFSLPLMSDYPYPGDFCEPALELLRLNKQLDPADFTQHLIKTGYKVTDYHWRQDRGPFSTLSRVEPHTW